MSCKPNTTISRTKAFPGRYRTIAPNSQVDETLFRNPDQVTSQRNLGAQAMGKSQKSRQVEKIQIISKDRTHNPRVPLANQMEKQKEPKAVETRRKLTEKSCKEKPVLTGLEQAGRTRAERVVKQSTALKTEQKVETKKPNQATSRRISGAQAKVITEKKREGETIQIISKDLIRNLRVPLANQMEKQKEPKAVETRRKLTEKSCKEKPVLTGLEQKGRTRAERVVKQSTALKTEQKVETKKPNQATSRRISGAQAKVITEKKREGETIQIISKDLIRNLRVPPKDPPRKSVIVPRAQFEKMTSARGILTKEEREAQRKAFQIEKEKEVKDAADRRKMLERALTKDPELTWLEQEASAKAQRVVERANALMMEEEDEIKQVNQLIQRAHCHADRDLQIQENKMIQEEMAAEERRLDARIQEERREDEKTRDEVDERRKQQRIRGAQQINDQIQQHQREKKMKNLMKEQEREQLRQKEEQIKLEELRALEKKREEQALLQEEIVRINAEAMHAKEQKKEQEKMAALRDRKYIQKKMEQDAQREAEKKLTRKEKALENTKTWNQQQAAQKTKAEHEERQAHREHEELERKWRKSEVEKATKKCQGDKILKDGRKDQIRYKDHCMAIQLGREKTEFYKVLNKTRAMITTEKEQEERRLRNAQHNRQVIQKQMEEKKLSAAAIRKELLTGAEKRKEEARLKQLRIDALKEKKIAAMGLADKYRKEVVRKTQKIGLG